MSAPAWRAGVYPRMVQPRPNVGVGDRGARIASTERQCSGRVTAMSRAGSAPGASPLTAALADRLTHADRASHPCRSDAIRPQCRHRPAPHVRQRACPARGEVGTSGTCVVHNRRRTPGWALRSASEVGLPQGAAATRLRRGRRAAGPREQRGAGGRTGRWQNGWRYRRRRPRWRTGRSAAHRSRQNRSRCRVIVERRS